MRTLAVKEPSNTQRRQAEVNRAVVPSHRSLSSGVLQRKPSCACGGDCPRCQEGALLQTNLKISEPGDQYEQEADRIADRVMQMPEPAIQRQMEPGEDEEEGMFQRQAISGSITPLVQRQVSPDIEEEEEDVIQTKAIDDRATPSASTQESSEVPPTIHEVLRSPGQPLDPETRTFMEPRFGQDFSQVRIYTDAKAAESAQTLNATAYTMGRNIVFGKDQYVPETLEGQRLLAHELTHVIQQGTTDSIIKRQRREERRHPQAIPTCPLVTAQLRPVFFRLGLTDRTPTGNSLPPRLKEANRIWGKCGISFRTTISHRINDATAKFAGDNQPQLADVLATHATSGIGPEVFFFDNDLTFANGGVTAPNGLEATGDRAKILLSDRGKNDRLLAHELGHAMGLPFHPSAAPYIPTDSIMQPSESNNDRNLDRVTSLMCSLITWPKGLDSGCWHPDPDSPSGARGTYEGIQVTESSIQGSVIQRQQTPASTTLNSPWDNLPDDASRVIDKTYFNGLKPEFQSAFRSVYRALDAVGYWKDVVLRVFNVFPKNVQGLKANASSDLGNRLHIDLRFCRDYGIYGTFHSGMETWRQVVQAGTEGLHIGISQHKVEAHLDTIVPVAGRHPDGRCRFSQQYSLPHFIRDKLGFRGELYPEVQLPGEQQPRKF
jgi:hypothetical protein